ncbi:hypothetical protein [Ancylomarina sp.]
MFIIGRWRIDIGQVVHIVLFSNTHYMSGLYLFVIAGMTIGSRNT